MAGVEQREPPAFPSGGSLRSTPATLSFDAENPLGTERRSFKERLLCGLLEAQMYRAAVVAQPAQPIFALTCDFVSMYNECVEAAA